MFDLKTMAVIKKVHAGIDGLDGIMYDDATDKILTINHSHPTGTAVVIDPKSGDVVARVELTRQRPRRRRERRQGPHLHQPRRQERDRRRRHEDVEGRRDWPIAPCDGPTGIAMDRTTNRIFAGCSKTSVVVDATTGQGRRADRERQRASTR